MADGESQSTTAQGSAGGWEVLAPVLGALATGVGLLAFVALFGGAVLWDRANQVGLPGAEVVAVMPRNSLLATGSYFLAGALLLALVGVVGLWVTDTLLCRRSERIGEDTVEAAIREVGQEEASGAADADARASHPSTPLIDARNALAHAVNLQDVKRRQEGSARAALEEARQIEASQAEINQKEEALRGNEEIVRLSEREVQEAEDALISQIKRDNRGTTAGESTREKLKLGRSREAVRKAAKTVARAVSEVEQAGTEEQNALKAFRQEASKPTPDVSAVGAKTAAWEKSKAVLGEKKQKVDQAKESLTGELVRSKDRQWLIVRSVVLGGLLVLGEYLLVLYTQPTFDTRRFLYLLLVSLFTSVLAVLVYQATQKFVWFGVAAFLAIATFQGFATHFAISSAPKIEPAAALVTGLAPIKGVFVAQTNDRVYLGYPLGNSSSLIALRRDLVTGLAVGRLTLNGPDATKLADTLAQILCSQVPASATARTAKKPAESPKCPKQMPAQANSTR
jgi:hypothetical protein